ncbi:helix-turn-helix transcriptional regulator [Nocardia sp. GCM10030253]|uniref:helix-turn-helix transcriptional regulator n=1 Tax=Nocardia sp. GCM10030253 TaxID=3273404 RepID=UPI00363F5CC0
MQKTSSRLLSLLSLLQARRDWPGSLLAERLDVSPRTVRRDIDRLRELGYPIGAYKGPDGGYRLEAGTDLPPLLFDDDQAVALALALQIATTAGAGIEESAMRALTTVRQVMPARLRRRIDTVRIAAVEGPASQASPHVDSAKLVTLSAAVHAREVLRFDYAPANSGAERGDILTGPRRVEPHHLITRGGRWYLVVWDLDREAWRTFRADRITPRTPTGPRFTPRELPVGDLRSFVVGLFRGSDSSDDWPCWGEVIIELPAENVSPYVSDGFVESVGPARCRVVLGSWSWPGLVAAFAKFDADIEVVGPAKLRDAFSDIADRLARAASRSPRGPVPRGV